MSRHVELWELEDRRDPGATGVSWILFFVVVIVLVIVAGYFWQRSYTKQKESALCWKFVRTGRISPP